MKNDTHNKLSRRGLLKMAGSGAVGGMVAVGAGAANARPEDENRPINLLVHFADTDFSESVIRHSDAFAGFDAHLLMRSIAFIDWDQKLEKNFSKTYDAQDAETVLKQARTVFTPCETTAAMVTMTGGRAVFLTTPDTARLTTENVRKLGISVVDVTDHPELIAAMT